MTRRCKGLPFTSQRRRNVQVVWDDFNNVVGMIFPFLWTRDGELIAKSIRQQSPFIDFVIRRSIIVEMESDQWTFLTLQNEGYGYPNIDIWLAEGTSSTLNGKNSIVDPGCIHLLTVVHGRMAICSTMLNLFPL